MHIHAFISVTARVCALRQQKGGERHMGFAEAYIGRKVELRMLRMQSEGDVPDIDAVCIYVYVCMWVGVCVYIYIYIYILYIYI